MRDTNPHLPPRMRYARCGWRKSAAFYFRRAHTEHHVRARDDSGRGDLMARLDELLSRLAGLKQTRPDQWLARCPAHEDRSPSLSIKGADDGRILLKCFAGCETEDVLTAIGMSFSDLFPQRLHQISLPRLHSTLAPREMIEVLQHEIAVAALILADAVEGKAIDEPAWSRLAQSARRIAMVRDHGR